MIWVQGMALRRLPVRCATAPFAARPPFLCHGSAPYSVSRLPALCYGYTPFPVARLPTPCHGSGHFSERLPFLCYGSAPYPVLRVHSLPSATGPLPSVLRVRSLLCHGSCPFSARLRFLCYGSAPFPVLWVRSLLSGLRGSHSCAAGPVPSLNGSLSCYGSGSHRHGSGPFSARLPFLPTPCP
jgi:hypothetical protein